MTDPTPTRPLHVIELDGLQRRIVDIIQNKTGDAESVVHIVNIMFGVIKKHQVVADEIRERFEGISKILLDKDRQL